MIRKDLIFICYATNWLNCGMLFIYFYPHSIYGVDILNLIFVLMFCVLILFKKFTKFGNWLEEKL